MNKVELSFNTENDAFANYEGEREAARILANVAQYIKDGHRNGAIYDSNGNKVGRWRAKFPIDSEWEAR